MSDLDTTTREEQRDRLDEFVSMPMAESNLPALTAQPATPQIVGAQMVAVRRDEATVLQKLKVLAAAAGSDWYYRFPVKNRKENRTDWIEGPSIKLANDLARLYGNCEVDCRAQDLGSSILFHARFIDVETGFALTRPFQQRKGAAKLGGGDDQRREDITFQIGASKAIRNVVVNALQTFADFAFEEAKQALVDKIGANLVNWRDRTIQKIGAKVAISRVEAVIGRPAGEWLAPDVARVIAMAKAVEDGMSSMDDTFPVLGGDAGTQATAEAQLDGFADSQRGTLNQDRADPTTTPPRDEAAAPAQTNPPEGAAADEDIRVEIATKVIDLASDKKLSMQERLEALELWRDTMRDTHPELVKFVDTAATTAVRVAKDEMPAAAARKYLQGLVK